MISGITVNWLKIKIQFLRYNKLSFWELLYKSYFLHNAGERAQYDGEQIKQTN